MIIIALSEPNASDVEKEGYGYIVASVGELGGNAPYTAYNARKSYIENNPKIIEGFTKAINKALEYVNREDPDFSYTVSNGFDITSNMEVKVVYDIYYKDNADVIKDIEAFKFANS